MAYCSGAELFHFFPRLVHSTNTTTLPTSVATNTPASAATTYV